MARTVLREVLEFALIVALVLLITAALCLVH
jgi:hypothetical protein